jgi:hypothetical protein
VRDVARSAGRCVVVIVGDADPEVADHLRSSPDVQVLSLVELFGEARPFAEPRWCIEHAARTALVT